MIWTLVSLVQAPIGYLVASSAMYAYERKKRAGDDETELATPIPLAARLMIFSFAGGLGLGALQGDISLGLVIASYLWVLFWLAVMTMRAVDTRRR